MATTENQPGGDFGRAIDAHVHVWTPDTQRYPLAAGFARENMAPASFTPEELFAHCRPQGVDRVVLIQMSFYRFDNRYMLDMIEKHPGVFRGVAIVDETKANLRETMNHLAGSGARGFRIYADQEWAEETSNSPGTKAMWGHAADTGLVVCLLADPEALPAARRLCRNFPKTRVVIDHFARIGMRSPPRQADLDNLCRLAEFQHTYVKPSAFYGLGAKKAPDTDMAPLVRQLRDAYGASRLMWASDCPFQVQGGHTYADSIALIRDRLDFLSGEDKAWILGRTAEGLFFG